MNELKFINQLDTPESTMFLLNVGNISQTLWVLDLASTGCKENKIYDEYAIEADEIAKMVQCGFPMRFSIKTVMDAFFWDDFLTDEALEVISNHLQLK
jgi:hypothetical protein